MASEAEVADDAQVCVSIDALPVSIVLEKPSTLRAIKAPTDE